MLAASILIALMMEPASTSETSVNFHQTTRLNNPEEIHLHTRRRENLKSHTATIALKKVYWKEILHNKIIEYNTVNTERTPYSLYDPRQIEALSP
jgi:hypothetical protein